MKIKRYKDIEALRIVTDRWSLWITTALTNTNFKCPKTRAVTSWLIPFPFSNMGLFITLFRYILPEENK